ncbi:putative transporter protein [Fulvimarina pelagi HTCC2506]|uniref:Putative transporter protein n=1 Tax=Fulvimarina pelagi HTCC2506 TaxID=314231 RepID=Q0G3E7_9HYPH|nr:MFS transporter [Fulvimarina pelagi]EAU41884.1 putative transporter protein [Fulvimarina pelagi HTCC2506]
MAATSESAVPAETHERGGIGTLLTTLFAFACGALAANLYYAQPLVALIGTDTGLSVSLESFIVTAAQAGYAIGLVCLVPLGDILENRKLILGTMGLNLLSLAGLALLPGLGSLFAMTLVVGVTSVAAQMIVPLAANLAPANQRGAVVGNVMTGLLGGILLARPIASFLADYVGWRGVFGVSGLAIGIILVIGFFFIPHRQPSGGKGYGELIGSLGRLFLTEPVLRRRGLYHAAMFAAFSVFWTAAPIILLREPFGFSSTEVALFTLAGVLGVFAAPVAGRLADRGHTRTGTIVAIALAIFAFVLAWFGETTFWPLLLAGIVIDLGVQANLVLGQREIYQLDESIRNRLNAVYMTTFFLGGALGSALASPLLENFGWTAICLVGGGMPAAALAYFALVEGRASSEEG